MYGMLYGTVRPYLQHECMAWYGSMAPLVETEGWAAYLVKKIIKNHAMGGGKPKNDVEGKGGQPYL